VPGANAPGNTASQTSSPAQKGDGAIKRITPGRTHKVEGIEKNIENPGKDSEKDIQSIAPLSPDVVGELNKLSETLMAPSPLSTHDATRKIPSPAPTQARKNLENIPPQPTYMTEELDKWSKMRTTEDAATQPAIKEEAAPASPKTTDIPLRSARGSNELSKWSRIRVVPTKKSSTQPDATKDSGRVRDIPPHPAQIVNELNKWSRMQAVSPTTQLPLA
jgi:hypothetical protein